MFVSHYISPTLAKPAVSISCTVQAESNCSPQVSSRPDMSIIYIKLNEMLTKDVSNLTGEKLPWAIQP